MKNNYLIICFVMILLVSTISAWDFDNVKTYDAKNEVITVKNAFGLGETLVRMQLMTPRNNYVIDRGDGVFQKVAEIKLHEFKGDLSGAFSNTDIYNAYNMRLQPGREVKLKYRITVSEYEEPIWNGTCVKPGDCTDEIIGYNTIELYDWIEFTDVSELPKNNVFIGVFVDVLRGEKGEWIPNKWFGEELPEWAEWTEGLNEELNFYYTFNETSGDFVDSVGNGTNLVGLVHNTTDTKIGTGAAQSNNINHDNTGVSYENSTVNFWFRFFGDTDDEVVMGTCYDASLCVNGEVIFYDSKAANRMDIYVANTVSNPRIYRVPRNTVFQMVTLFANTTTQIVYVNGTEVHNSLISNGRTSNGSLTWEVFGTRNGAIIGRNYVVDELSLWDRELTASEVSDLWNNGAGLSYLPVVPTPPDVNITYPLNTTYISSVNILNYTILDTGSDEENCWYSTDSGTTNTTISVGVNVTGLNANVGTNTWVVGCNDTIGNTGSDKVTFVFSPVSPNLTLTTPSNTTYTSIQTEINFTVEGADACFYSTNGGTTNISTSCSTNITGLNSGQGSSTWLIGANTTLGGLNNSYVTFFVDSINPSNTITYPTGDITDDYVTSNDKTIRLNWTVLDTNLNACWYYNNTANVTVTCGTNVTFTLPYGTYNHFVYANDTLGNVGTASQTSTYSYKILENSHNFTGVIPEGTEDTYTINISSNGAETVTAQLYYDGTLYSTSKYGNNSDMRFVRTFSPPGSGNKDVLWTVDYGGTLYNTSLYQQNISDFNMTECSAGQFVIYNFTVYDEELKTKFAGSAENLTIDIDLNVTTESGTMVGNFSIQKINTNPFAVCTPTTLGSKRLVIDGIVRYEANLSHISEFYTIQNFSLTSTSLYQNISLYDLKTADAQEFKVTYKDENFQPLLGAMLEVQRYYISDGVYRVVEAPPFDNNGETLANFQLGDVIYTLVIKKDGIIHASFPNIKAFCNNVGTGDCTIDLDSFGASLKTEDFATVKGVVVNLDYDSDTRTVTASYVVQDGTTKSMLLNVTLMDMYGNVSVCSDPETASSGTLSCVIPTSYGNASVIGNVYANEEFIGRISASLWDSGEAVYGGSQMTLAILSFLSLVGVALGGSVVVTGMFIVLGFIVNVAFFMLNNGGFIGSGSLFLWIAITIITILWKASRRND